jgi:hypothetical protein
MLLVVTAFAVWLGWELNYIQQRQAARKLANNSLLARDVVAVGKERPRIPVWRTMLGDEAVTIMWLKEGISDEEAARTVSLFPEAEVLCPPHWKTVSP